MYIHSDDYITSGWMIKKLVILLFEFFYLNETKR